MLLISGEQPQCYRITRPNLEDNRRENYLFQLIYSNYYGGYVLTDKRLMNLGIIRDVEEIKKITISFN